MAYVQLAKPSENSRSLQNLTSRNSIMNTEKRKANTSFQLQTERLANIPAKKFFSSQLKQDIISH